MAKKQKDKKPECGLVMPISECDGCSESHWLEVRSIVEQSLQKEFDVSLVSEVPEIALIQGSIVVNLKKKPIVVCDVSGQNPNCMIELGMRLAFDMPIIVIKDDITKFTFDISPIEHLGYPRDLRHGAMEAFKKKLLKKAQATYQAKEANPKFSQYLGQFKEFEHYAPKAFEVVKESTEQQILRSLNELTQRMNRVTHSASAVKSQQQSWWESRDPEENLSFATIERIRDVLEGIQFEPNLDIAKARVKDVEFELSWPSLAKEQPDRVKYLRNLLQKAKDYIKSSE